MIKRDVEVCPIASALVSESSLISLSQVMMEIIRAIFKIQCS